MTYNIVNGYKDNSFKEISLLMKKYNIGFIPIKDKDEYIGVITDRDVCLAIHTINNVNNSIKSYITNSVIYVDVDSDTEYRIVYEIDIGILSLSDILNYTNNNNILNTYKTIFYINDNTHNSIAKIDEFYL